MLPSVKGFMIALTVEALIMGAYVASFLLCLRWLVFSDKGGTLRKGINWPLLTIAIVLFALTATAFIIFLSSTVSFISKGRSINNLYTTFIGEFIALLLPIITDGVLVFRCWIVYNRSWRVALLPFLLLLYNISSLFVLTRWNFGILLVMTESVTIQVEGITASYYASTTIINIYATSAIIFQIWRNSISRRRTRFAVRVIAESGLLYTLTSIATCCGVFFGSSHWLVLVIGINFHTAGVAYNLIMIRVAQNRAQPEAELPTFIGNSTIERAMQTVPHHNSETVDSS
ncbi:hypothetical protein F5887DRAFT_1077593 [Amanita rubescens]|nr:hypothetical protein F5887DRAFT_1077593 [Amanita rubescens]